MEKLFVDDIPAVVFGDNQPNVFLFVHGKKGSKQEGEAFYENIKGNGWQVLAIDLPMHGENRTKTEDYSDKNLEWGFNDWTAKLILQKVFAYASARWKKISIRANSIGAHFCMLALGKDFGESIEKALFVSPIVDMKKLICNMMTWANVDENRLQKERTIKTNFGEDLSWDYLCYARENPIEWKVPTFVLYGERDNLTSFDDICEYSKYTSAKLTIMPNGEHWFHTNEQLEFLKNWEKLALKE